MGYSQGIQYLMTGLKYEKNQKVVAAIKEKVQKYLKRAEDIKTSLEEPPKKTKKKKVKAKSSGGGGDDSDDEDKEEDEDTAKNERCLSQCHRNGKAQYQMGRCCRSRSRQIIAQRSRYFTHQIPSTV